MHARGVGQASRLPFVVFACAALTSACVVPSQTSDMTVAGETISPATTFFAIVQETFDSFIGGPRTEDVAIVLMGNLACDDIPADCSAPATGAHASLRIILNESLFGDTQLGDYDVPQDGGFTVQLADETELFAQEGNINLFTIDDSRLVASYDVTLINEEDVSGDVVAEACPAFEANRAACGEL